jgi:membrane-associated phospholipid phosphatase
MTSVISATAADVGELPANLNGAADAAQTAATTANIGAALVLLAAAGLFAFIARRVATRESVPLDQRVRESAQSHRTGLVDAATKPITLLSVPILVVSATAALVWYLKENDRDAAALGVGIAPLVAAALGQSFTTFFTQPEPPAAGGTPNGEAAAATFPSGHTTGVTAEALGIAYVLTREGLASPAIVGSLVAWPLVVGATRVYRDRHWASDILAGWLAGTGVAALTALIYEWRRRSRPLAQRMTFATDVESSSISHSITDAGRLP